MIRRVRTILVALVLPIAAAASQDAFDTASSHVYADGWQTGDDGGFGWNGGWILATDAGRGYELATSTANGDGDSDGDGDIDANDVAWLASSEGDGVLASATRRFVGTLEVGQIVAADIDYDPAGGEVTFAVENASGLPRFRFITSPSVGARILDSGVLDISGALPASDEGLFLQFVLTGSTTYVLILTPGGGGSPVEFERTLGGSGGIDRLEFRVNAEAAVHREAFLNRITVPEPAGAALSALAALALVRRRRAA